MQVCPQLKNLPNRMRLTAGPIFALSSTMTGHLPPSYSMQGTKFLAASMATSLPVAVDPVKQITSTGNLVTVLATSTLPSMTLKYPEFPQKYVCPYVNRKVA